MRLDERKTVAFELLLQHVRTCRRAPRFLDWGTTGRMVLNFSMSLERRVYLQVRMTYLFRTSGTAGRFPLKFGANIVREPLAMRFTQTKGWVHLQVRTPSICISGTAGRITLNFFVCFSSLALKKVAMLMLFKACK